MCLIPLYYFQPLSLKNYCWWLKQLMILGAGVAGLSVLTPEHTLPTILAVHLLTQIHLPPHELQKCSGLAIRVLPITVHPHA